jgi:hypothetical protein
VIGCAAFDSVRGRRAGPGGPIHQDTHWRVDHRPAPALVLGYLVVKTTRHVESLAALGEAEAVGLGPILRATCLAVEAELGAERGMFLSDRAASGTRSGGRRLRHAPGQRSSAVALAALGYEWRGANGVPGRRSAGRTRARATCTSWRSAAPDRVP